MIYWGKRLQFINLKLPFLFIGSRYIFNFEFSSDGLSPKFRPSEEKMRVSTHVGLKLGILRTHGKTLLHFEQPYES